MGGLAKGAAEVEDVISGIERGELMVVFLPPSRSG
jgi:hypothetical protein